MSSSLRADLLALLFVVVYALVLFGASRWARWRLLKRARLAAGTLAAAGARVGAVRPSPGLWKPAEVDFELDGKPASLHIRHWGRDYLLISVHIDSPPLPAILIRSERTVDRIGKSLGLSREVQLGDAAFDAAAYLVTGASEELVRRTLAAAEARTLVVTLLQHGYRVELSREGLRGSRLQSVFSAFDPTPVPAVMRTLESLLAALPRLDPATLVDPPVRQAYVPALACAAVAVVGFAALRIFAGEVHAPLDDRSSLGALGLGLCGWVLAVAGLWFALRGRAQAHFELVACAFALLIGVPALTALGLFAANSSLDRAPMVPRRAQIVRLARHDHEVYVTPWPGRVQQKVGVRWATFKRLHEGDTIEVDTHPGALGWPWVSDVRPATAP